MTWMAWKFSSTGRPARTHEAIALLRTWKNDAHDA